MARELREVTIADALELTALYTCKDRPRFQRAAVRWLQRWLDELGTPTLADVGYVVGCLGALVSAHVTLKRFARSAS